MSIGSTWVKVNAACAALLLFPLSSGAQTTNFNLAPSCDSATVSPVIIDPADDRMQSLVIQVPDPDGHAVTVSTQCILQSEPAEFYSDGTAISGDGTGIGTSTPAVKAKRLTNFILTTTYQYYRTNGRLYDVIFEAQDSEGAACVGTVTVEAPLYLGSHQNPDAATQDFGFRFVASQNGVNCDAEPFNNPPVIHSVPPEAGTVGSPIEYQLLAHDPDSDALSFALVSAPAGVQLDAQSGLLQWTPSSEHVGDNAITVKAVDAGGLEVSQTFNIQVQSSVEVGIEIVANPTSGLSPLTVQFSPMVNNNNLVVAEYLWDFDGDGIVDHSDRFGAPVTHTYTGAPGTTFLATLTAVIGEEVADPEDQVEIVTTKLISLDNQKPVVTVSSNTTNGHVPLEVNFNITAQDPQGIATVEMDFDGDGSFDEVQQFAAATPINTSFQRTYQAEGTFVPTVRVTDALGAVTTVSNNAISVDVNNPQDPTVVLSAAPSEGAAPLVTSLTAEATLFDGSDVQSWAWDTDGDGTFETTGGSALIDSISATYAGLDDYYPVAKVTTTSGREATVAVHVRTLSSTQPTLTIPNVSDTINLDDMEMATFSVNLPYQTLLTITVESASGAVVKTLAEENLFAAGVHEFVWDGTNDNDEFVSQADYYVVLGYQAYGEQRELDLRTSTGGNLTYYTRPDTNPRTFNRLERPIPINYAVNDPAQVTFFWQVSFGVRLMTLLEHERMGRGSYTLHWNGEYPNGKKIADTVDFLMPGILRYTLPDNVIFVKEDPRILDYTLQSTIIADPRREPIEMLLTTTKDSDIEIVVSDMEKGVDVANRMFQSVPAGENALHWDGKNNADQLLAPGDYRIGVRSIDSTGSRSLYWYRTQRIDY